MTNFIRQRRVGFASNNRTTKNDLYETPVEIYIYDELFFRIEATKWQHQRIVTKFTEKAFNFQFHPLYRQKVWDGNLHFYEMIGNHAKLLPRGLLLDLMKFLKGTNIPFKMKFDPKDIKNDYGFQEIFQIFEAQLTNKMFDIRDYQVTAVHKMINTKKCCIVVGTGGGKSMMLYQFSRWFIDNHSEDVILMVPNTTLVEQLHKDFSDYQGSYCGDWCGRYYEVHKEIDRRVIISTRDSLFDKPEDWFRRFGALLMDECHNAKEAPAIKKLLCKLRLAEYRIGLTGTLPKHPSHVLNIKAYLGATAYELTSDELKKRGVVSHSTHFHLCVEHGYEIHDNLWVTNPDPDQEELVLVDYMTETSHVYRNPARLKALDIIVSKAKLEDNILVLTTEVDRDIKDVLYPHIKANYPDWNVIEFHGKDDTATGRKISTDDRMKARETIESSGGNIILATFNVASTGVNIKRLNHLVMWSSLKSYELVVQAIGRLLRLHDSKSMAYIWYVVDKVFHTNSRGTERYNRLWDHHLERVQILKEQKHTQKEFHIPL